MSTPKPLTVDTVNRSLAAAPAYWMFDWDGTLVDLAPRPDAIVVPDSLIRSLARLVQQNPGRVAIISGRGLNDLESRIPLDAVNLVGNHGAEWRLGSKREAKTPDERTAAALEAVRHPLHALVNEFPQSALEDKTWTLSFHFRSVPAGQRESLHEQVKHIVDPHSELELRPADACWEIRPKNGATKADAVRRLLADAPPNTIPFIFGDDWTDEDAFQAAESQGLTVVVGPRRPTIARYCLDSAHSLRELLERVAGFGL